MPRPLRIHVPGAFHHVTLRGNHRQDIFFSAADRQIFADLVAEVIDRFCARVHAFCWMTNHVHLLVQVGDAPLGNLMLRIASRYARSVQRRFQTTGHLFERRYHAVLVDADEYLLELLRYIHLNPVRAGMVRTADDYPWSSHHAYVDASVIPWLTTDFALRRFHSEREPAIAAYRRFIGGGDPESRSPLEECNPNDRRVLGDDRFLAKLLRESWCPRSRKSLDQLIADACRQFDVTLDALQSSSRQRQVTRTRAWIAHQAVTLRIASLSEVARRFGRNEASLRDSVNVHFQRKATLTP
jgi:REP element-mobilizing transposase RayT